ncbi:hypothetical protein K490DRAFT_39705 [Saccharata proteae CBS 121410]|uniref:Transcription factor IIIC putative zinc-finger domain-containing protein n=1 Tax=Saccharata proteae CBS 121410 TaxID=1314787 RepID=A0A9P4HY23_9PEZI|nr:hypothetical protein K490DRAFT_39705 [Saccharata proteae CBS 121410]
MHEVTTVTLWPSRLRCLSWSYDCELAVATGETVELLVPKLGSIDEAKSGAAGPNEAFDNVHIRTNLFDVDDAPLLQPLGNRDYSIGEEISVGTVVATEWSSPGLAKHGRCALAVLTSNLKLSIWASDSNPREASSWKRVLVVHPELEKYFMKVGNEREKPRPELVAAQHRRQERVRAFAWSLPMRPDASSRHSIYDSQLPLNGPLIAVSNDENDVVILRVRSPYDLYSSLSASPDWAFEAVIHFSVDAGMSVSQANRPILFDEYLQQQSYVGNIAWSPWRITCQSTSSELTIGPAENIAALNSIPNSPISILRWMSKTVDDHFILVAIDQAEVVCVQVSIPKDSEYSPLISRHDLDRSWYETAGCAFSHPRPHGLQLHFTPQVLASVAPTVGLKLPISSSETIVNPFWQRSIADHERLFSAEHDLDGHVQTKIWGFCSSPLGDLATMALTLHPSDQLDYTIAAWQRTLISLQWLSDAPDKFSLPLDITAEAILFSVKRWLVHNSASLKTTTNVKEMVMQQIWVCPSLSQVKFFLDNRSRNSPGQIDTRDRRVLIQELRRAIYFNSDALRERYETLIAPLVPNEPNRTSGDRTVVRNLVRAAVSVPGTAYRHNDFSKSIKSLYSAAESLLQRGTTAHPASLPFETSAEGEEQCEFCDSPIKLWSLTKAQCEEGHQFSRCSLTFLAIQEPGISKSCCICGRHYLNQQFISQKDGSVSSTASASQKEAQDASQQAEQGAADGMSQPLMTLAELLFSACNVCVYCGGKFVG